MKPLVYIPGGARFENYRNAVTAAGGAVRCDGAPAGCDALLLPGGGDLEPWRYGEENTASRGLEPERDAEELALLAYFCDRELPVLGVCRGIQVINVFFDGTLVQDVPAHGQTLEGADRLHPVVCTPSPLSTLYGAHCTVNSAHHQAVARLGSGLDAVQWTADGTVEAVCHRALPVWGVQWHPERLRGRFARPGAVDGEALFRAFLGLCR